ncbi:transporter substrate-binding domain-containing protein [Paraglaciecola aquimarina]|uniref:Transporter substrate-binding domain-containing protein n=1 Tax=Paraglaciecola algarum TaxID=3050085 RepID=A0ABS9D384_9ALTE|nr:transporter substrate-binding domain-containing protein [Paraglaciecola sp. G1-23]
MNKLFFLLCLICNSSFASKLRIITVNEPPASFINSQGKADGYVTEIIEALKAEVQSSARVEFVPEARALNIGLNHPNVVLFSFSRTPFREKNYHWVGLVLEKNWSVFALNNSDLKINSLADLRELPSVGVVRGDIREEWLINRKFLNLYSVTEHAHNVKGLLKNRVPVILYEQQGLAYLCQSLGIDTNLFKSLYVINKSEVYIAMSKKNTSKKLLNKWRKAFIKIKSNGVVEGIAQKWQQKIYADLNINSEINDSILVF